MIEAVCRCGWDGSGDHPCHGKAYTCRLPAKGRLYDPTLPCLAGMQMKVQLTETFACDGCWEEFLAYAKERR